MRAVVQRVSEASVTVDGAVVGEIAGGLLVLLGVEDGDTDRDAQYIIDKISGLRIFDDQNGQMNLDLTQVGGKALVVSQFTLLGDVRKGRRPGFTAAAKPEIAKSTYEHVCEQIAQRGVQVERGIFQADMKVRLINDGPVTILLDSRKLF